MVTLTTPHIFYPIMTGEGINHSRSYALIDENTQSNLQKVLEDKDLFWALFCQCHFKNQPIVRDSIFWTVKFINHICLHGNESVICNLRNNVDNIRCILLANKLESTSGPIICNVLRADDHTSEKILLQTIPTLQELLFQTSHK